MIPLALGLAAVVVLLAGAEAFGRARVGTIRALLAWVAALAGVSLAALLLLTGRGAAAFGGALFMAPLAWTLWQESRMPVRRGGRRMERREALRVLGLGEGASESDVRAAWVRLLRVVHPDGGGTADLASRVNAAKEVLLGR